MSEIKEWAGLVPSEVCEGRICSRFFPWLVDGHHLPVSLDIFFFHCTLCVQNFPLFIRTWQYWIRVPPYTSSISPQLITSAIILVPVRAHSEVLTEYQHMNFCGTQFNPSPSTLWSLKSSCVFSHEKCIQNLQKSYPNLASTLSLKSHPHII